MPNLADSVANIIAKFGQPCTIVWPQLGAGSNALPAQTIRSNVRISSRSFYNASGALQSITTGMLPATARNLQGATIRVGNTTYKVQGNVENVYQGSVLFQKVTLQ